MGDRIEYIHTSPLVIETNALQLSQVQNISRNPSLSTLVVCLVSVPIGYSSQWWWRPAVAGDQQCQVYIDINTSRVDGGQELLSMAQVIKVF